MKTIYQLAVVLLISMQLNAQKVTVSGIISDENNLPLPGVNILIKGTTIGTQTNFEGYYSIETKIGDVLVFSFIGYKIEEYIVGANNKVSLNIYPDAKLEEVVIVGYGSTKTRNTVSASVSQIKRQKRKSYHNQLANQVKSTSIVNSLQGKVTGVKIEGTTGNVGPSTRILLRGTNSISGNNEPLVIIDGKISNHTNLGLLEPKNIQSINVLKGANATAIYGNRGANGVIVISTKHKQKPANKKLLYIVDGKPIKKENNYLIENLAESQIESKVEYNRADAKDKFGKIAKNGCVVITTYTGNFRISEDESYAVIEENDFETVKTSPLSTFSIDVDKASYSNVRRMINNGNFVEPDAVKIEEMINYFEYDYPQPIDEHPFSINTELASTPWNKDTKLVKIGLQGKTYKNENLPPSNLTFLLDVSGSMSSNNKLPLLKQAFKFLVNQLREQDKVSIVVYAGAAGVVLEPTSGKHREKILNALDNLEAGGSTAGGAGIELAYKLAEKNFNKKGNNRVILATDGDFNVGSSSDKAMEELIVEKRKTGVFLSVLGFGYGNYKDSKLETLADKGNGNHAYIDNMQEAQKVFGKEFGGTLFTIAKDVKIQVEFNPSKVQAYRLIGYENRMLADEDFIDDTKDAGELGSGHTVTALYEIIPVGIKSEFIKEVHDLKYTSKNTLSNFSDELLTVKFRYKKPDGNKSIEMVHIQNDKVSTPSVDMKFSAAVALLGMQLRQSKYYNGTTYEDVIKLATDGKGDDKDGYRGEFIRLVRTYKGI